MFTVRLYYRPGQAYIKWHLTTVLHDFCASYNQPNSSTHQSENYQILLVHMYNKLRTNLYILMEQHLPQWWWGLLEHRQIQTSQLSRLQKQVQSTLLLIQVSLCCQSVKNKHLTWVLLSTQSERGTNSFQSHTNIHKTLLLSVHRTYPLFWQSVFIIHTKRSVNVHTVTSILACGKSDKRQDFALNSNLCEKWYKEINNYVNARV